MNSMVKAAKSVHYDILKRRLMSTKRYFSEDLSVLNSFEQMCLSSNQSSNPPLTAFRAIHQFSGDVLESGPQMTLRESIALTAFLA